MTISIPKATSYVHIFKAYLSSDHVSEATGKTIAITISKNGGAFGNPNAGATNATEISSGWYKVTLDTTDTGTNGWLAIRGAVATVDDIGDRVFVVNATNGGLTALPDTAVTTNGTLITAGTGTSQLSVTSGQVILQTGTGTGQLDFTSGVVKANVTQNAGSNITAASGIQEVKVASIAANAITATSIASDAITDAKVAADVTIASVTGAVGSVTGAVGSVTGNVGGNVAGSVGSVTGAVGSVTGLTASDVGAIKTATDQLTFTVANQLDANVQYVNGIAINGTGTSGDPWGP